MKKIAVLAVIVALSFAGIQNVFGEKEPKDPKRPPPALKVIDPKGKGEIECDVLHNNLNKSSFLHCLAKNMTILIGGEKIDEWTLGLDPQRGVTCCDEDMTCCRGCCGILEPMCQKGVFDGIVGYPIPPELNCPEE